MSKFKYVPALIITITIAVLIIVTAIIMKSVSGNTVNTTDGESYIEALGNQNVQAVENGISGNVEESQMNQGEETLEPPIEDPTVETKPLDAEGFYGSNQASYIPYTVDDKKAGSTVDMLEDGTLSTKELFKDTLFVGDSIMTGFSDFQLANKGNVIAEVGSSLKPHLETNLDKIINYNPKYLVLHYGLNEMGIEDYYLDSFIEEYTKCLEELKKKLPATKIIVVGCMPVKESAVENQPRLGRVEAYNKRMREMCVKLGVAYNEDSQFFVDNAELYTKDGIHVQKKVYIMWINYLVKEMGIY